MIETNNSRTMAFQGRRMNSRWPWKATVLVAMFLSLPAYGQEMSPEEHASHHPGQAAAAATPEAGAGSAPAAASGGTDGSGMDGGGTGGSGTGGGGMGSGGTDGGGTGDGGMGGSGTDGGGGMGDMMNDMGKAPPLELYPSLMNLPDETPEQRQKILEDANERMRAAVSLLATGVDRLADAVDSNDFAAMQDATSKMHQALGKFESGVAAQRALSEGQPPRQVAMQWFKSEMNLQSPQGVTARVGVMGESAFHLFSMVLLIVFAVAMIALYFVKMRRAAALFSRIEANKGAPPPGAAPALAGSPPPAQGSTGAGT